MKELITRYAAYNIWANKLVIEAIMALPSEASETIINSSFPTIKATIMHTAAAEDIWRQRLELSAAPTWTGDLDGTINEVCDRWIKASAAIADLVAIQTEDVLTGTITFSNRQGRQHSNTAAHILLHVFNHSTYHRGQIITMLRQAGATLIPATDFIAFIWKS